MIVPGMTGVGPIGGFAPSDVPQAEADALIAFYDATDGDNWDDNTGWTTDPVVGNWYGVTVAGGHVTELDVGNNSLSGAAGNTLEPLASSLTYLRCGSNSISTLDVSTLTALTYLNCGNNSISTLDVSALTSLTTLRCDNNSISTLDVLALTALTYLNCDNNSISTLDVSALTSLTNLHCDNNSISTLDVSNLANGLSYLDASDNGMDQANVDAIITDIWTRRADWTDATPELHVGGTNATPTGTYQDGYPTPLDELEMVHDLINDDDSAGIQTWAAISWNGGSAP